VKNTTIGTSDARTASVTTMAFRMYPASSLGRSLGPSSALKTYNAGSVTATVSRKSAGTFAADARG
jgi:hypothetical protein